MKELEEELANAPREKEARIKSKLYDAENRVEQATKQREFLQLTLEFIQDHPYLSALIAVTAVAAGAGVIMFGGKLVVVSKFAWKAKVIASGTGAATASVIPTSTAIGAGVATGVGAGTVDVSAKLSTGLIALLVTAVGAGVIVSKDVRESKMKK
jgi:ElaB/YqjD/DUF883 family membrane-anchored ribosome-binding protein